MLKIASVPVLVATVRDIADHANKAVRKFEGLRVENVNLAFTGYNPVPEFKIPSAHLDGRMLYFNNRELLCRFATMAIMDQRGLLSAIHIVMASQQVDRLQLEIQWSERKKRSVLVSRYIQDNLGFTLLP